jgi:hypothetical protein
MTRSTLKRSTLVLSLALTASLATLGFTSSAMAAPKGIFAIFSDCPLSTPGVTLCQYGQTTGGEVSIGTSKVPINKTITLQGGAIPTGNPENEREYFLVPAADGNSLSKTELNVPGGLAGLVNCEEIKGSGLVEVIARGTCKATFENPLTTGVTATTEIAASATNPPILNLINLFFESGTAIALPVKVHLKNPLLGSSRYIGSVAHPIELHLTTGATSPNPPNTSIHGSRGTLEVPEEKEQPMVRLLDNSLVDNAFLAPVAEGCGGLIAFLINPIVNAKLKLPSPDGANTAILNGTLNSGAAESVLASEKF